MNKNEIAFFLILIILCSGIGVSALVNPGYYIDVIYVNKELYYLNQTLPNYIATHIGNMTGIQGPPGPQGPMGYNGTQGIQGPIGYNGTQGVQGNPGVDGATWYSGSGVPDSGLGVSGDYYLDTDTSYVYMKTTS